MENNKTFQLNIFTINNNKNEMFNYHTNKITKHKSEIYQDTKISRSEKNINTEKSSIGSNSNVNKIKKLFEIKKEKDIFYIENKLNFYTKISEDFKREIINKIWFVLNSEKNKENINDSFSNKGLIKSTENFNEEYLLNSFDIIKFGKILFSINEIFLLEKKDLTLANDYIYNFNTVNKGTFPVFDLIFSAEKSEENSENICKYCFNEGNTNENPLVNLCACAGGSKYIHFECLKLYLNTKLDKDEKFKNSEVYVRNYKIKNFECEICKTPYPFRFSIRNDPYKVFELIEVEKNYQKNFVVLESLNIISKSKYMKSIHVIYFNENAENTIKIGRNSNCDIVIQDISVSRYHSEILFSSKGFIIRDNNSKFGTLVLMKRDVEINDKKLTLQIRMTLINIEPIFMKNRDLTLDYDRENDEESILKFSDSLYSEYGSEIFI